MASTGFINPSESKRISFWLRDAASDAIPSSFTCDPVVTLNEADLMRANTMKPKNSGDAVLAQTDVSLTARVGDRTKIDRRKIVAEGLITNNSSKTITAINLICQGLVNELGLVRSVGGYTNVMFRLRRASGSLFRSDCFRKWTQSGGSRTSHAGS